MQSDISLHPATPRWNPANATLGGRNALTVAILAGRDFSFLLSARELEVREFRRAPEFVAREALSRAQGYGLGEGSRGPYQGD